MDKPFIHLIKSRYAYYFFDVNTERIAKISSQAYAYLKKLQNGEDVPVPEEARNEIENLKQNGYLKSNFPQKIEMQETNLIGYYIRHRLEKLTLQVTQQCNFCCSYCPYTLGDDEKFHAHNAKNMSWDTAKRAIDFFAERTRDTSFINMSFYGGEPLLRFGLITRCMEYAKEVFKGRRYSFSMTTNASLLTVDKAKYLMDNGVDIQVSLDGPKEIQDKNRKKKSDGSGTYETVMRNLKNIKKEIPDYYKKLSFNSVVDPANDCGKVNSYFSDEFFDGTVISTPMVDPIEKKRVYYSDSFIDCYKTDLVSALMAYTGLSDATELTPISLNMYNSTAWFENGLKSRESLPARVGHSGPCRPGIMRLFVTYDGRFYPCEKVNDCSDALRIGSIDAGLDEEKIKQIYNTFHMRDEKCKTCWNIMHCNICAKSIVNGNEISEKLYDEACYESCKNTENFLRRITAIRDAQNIMANKEERYEDCNSISV